MTERISEDDDGNLVISTPLLTKLDNIQREQAAGFAGLREALDGKADKADLSRLEARWEGVDARVAKLETWRHDSDVATTVHQQRDGQVFTRRQKFWAAVAAVSTILAIIGASFVSALLH